MKNINHLTFEELINYLDLTTTDPSVRRLIDMLCNDNTNLIKELMDEGMSRDFIFEEDYESYSPGEYIRHLRNEVDYYSSEIDEKQYELERAERRIKALEEKIKVWTIMESK